MPVRLYVCFCLCLTTNSSSTNISTPSVLSLTFYSFDSTNKFSILLSFILYFHFLLVSHVALSSSLQSYFAHSLSCLVLFCPVLSCLVLSCFVLSCIVLSCLLAVHLDNPSIFSPSPLLPLGTHKMIMLSGGMNTTYLNPLRF